jgi:hypothetical protein
VLLLRVADVVRSLIEARDAQELGFVPFDRAGGELLFNLLIDPLGRFLRDPPSATPGRWSTIFSSDPLFSFDSSTIGRHDPLVVSEAIGFPSSAEERAGPAISASFPRLLAP